MINPVNRFLAWLSSPATSLSNKEIDMLELYIKVQRNKAMYFKIGDDVSYTLDGVAKTGNVLEVKKNECVISCGRGSITLPVNLLSIILPELIS